MRLGVLPTPGVKGGVVGKTPKLTNPQQGEPKMTADFQGVYASVLRDWLGMPPTELALGGGYAKLPIFKRTG